jgi:hypothetical protein
MPLGPPRASGTAIAVYLLSFVDTDGARRLFDALAEQHSSLLGFGGVREYAPGFSSG